MDTAWLLQRPIAHRGLHDSAAGIPENSLAAFQKAVDDNYPIELDVHLSADNEVVVFHDDDLQRLCGGKKLVNDLTLQQLKECRLLDTDQVIPSLAEVLQAVNGRVPLLIEIKRQAKKKQGIEEAVYKTLQHYKGQFAVQSFDPFLLKWFVKHAPLIARGQVSGNFKGEGVPYILRKVLQYYFLNVVSKPHFIAHDVSDLSNLAVIRLQKKGLPLLGWTLRSAAESKRIQPFCDNIIFEGFKP